MNTVNKNEKVQIVYWSTKKYATISAVCFFICLPIFFLIRFQLVDRITAIELNFFFYPIILFALANSLIVLGRIFTKFRVTNTDVLLSLPVVVFYIYLITKLFLVL